MRRHDLDWLRVIVFAFLIFYHVGMFFVPWGWHVKNNIIYDWLRFPMMWLNQWRLPILFVISGMGTYFAFSKRNGWQFAKERIARLLVPLLFGMFVIVPPQVYLEKLSNGQISGNYFTFWPSESIKGVYPTGNLSWNHLWFLPYLLIFSLILIPIFIYIKNNFEGSFVKRMQKIVSRPISSYIFILPLYLAEAFIEPFFNETHALIGDWFVLTSSCLLFFYGFLLMTVKETFWEMLQKYKKTFLWCGIIGFSILMFIIFSFEDGIVRHFTEAMVKVFNLWSWILAIFGYAATYLNKPGKLLSYCNEAVYPFYILHQTVTVFIGYHLMHLNWGLIPKAFIMIVGTFMISWLIYEFLIRRWRWVRPLFGLKKRLS